MKLVYPAIFTPFDEGNGFTVEVPDLPGCVTEGDNLVEAIEMGTDAASGWILGEIEDGNSFPAASMALEAPAGICLFLTWILTPNSMAAKLYAEI